MQKRVTIKLLLMYMQKCNRAFYFNECIRARWCGMKLFVRNIAASKRTEYGIIFTLKIESDIKYCYNLP